MIRMWSKFVRFFIGIVISGMEDPMIYILFRSRRNLSIIFLLTLILLLSCKPGTPVTDYPVITESSSQISTYPEVGAPENGQVYPEPASSVGTYPGLEYTYPYPEVVEADKAEGSGNVAEDAEEANDEVVAPTPNVVAPTPTAVAPAALISHELRASDPGSVEIASGDVQLVEFFAFW